MKLGNVSQAVIPVPNFFLNSNLKAYDAFGLNPQSTKKRSNSTFRDDDLLLSCLDLNINNNPRVYGTRSISINKEKYIPLYNRRNYENNAKMKETFFPNIIDFNKNKPLRQNKPKNGYTEYKEFMNKTNIHEFLHPKMREEIMRNTYNLIERINANYDMDQWQKFDNRTTFNKFYQTAYSPLTDVIKHEENVKEIFSKTLRDKALGLKTVSDKTKNLLYKTLSKKQFEENLNEKNNNDSYVQSVRKNLEKSLKTSKSNGLGMSDDEIQKDTYKTKTDFGSTFRNEKLDQLLMKNRTNLLKLKYNNAEPFNYNQSDQMFIDDNRYITQRINRTDLYKGFPSKTRMEFNEKKIIPNKKKFKILDGDNLVKKDKYNYKESELFNCRDDMWKRPMHNDAYKID